MRPNLFPDCTPIQDNPLLVIPNLHDSLKVPTRTTLSIRHPAARPPPSCLSRLSCLLLLFLLLNHDLVHFGPVKVSICAKLITEFNGMLRDQRRHTSLRRDIVWATLTNSDRNLPVPISVKTDPGPGPNPNKFKHITTRGKPQSELVEHRQTWNPTDKNHRQVTK